MLYQYYLLLHVLPIFVLTWQTKQHQVHALVACVTIQIKHPCYFYMVKPTLLLNIIFLSPSVKCIKSGRTYLNNLLFLEEHLNLQNAATAVQDLQHHSTQQKIVTLLMANQKHLVKNTTKHDRICTSQRFIISLLSNFFQLFISYR